MSESDGSGLGRRRGEDVERPIWWDAAKADTLTPEDRDWIIEQALGHYQDRWAERMIKGAASYEDALAFCREYLGNSGHASRYRRVDMWRSGIYAEVYGHQGMVSWRDVIERVRAAVVQPSLF